MAGSVSIWRNGEIDTHVFIWWLSDDAALGPRSRKLIAASSQSVYVSSATAWEIAIKRSLGQLVFEVNMAIAMEDNQFLSLAIDHSHGELAGYLPRLHGDPFDRMLIAQSQREGLTLLSADRVFSQYIIRLLDARK